MTHVHTVRVPSAAADNAAARRRRFGIAVRDARNELALTQGELAELVAAAVGVDAGLNQSTVSYWERGRSVPRDEHIDAVEEALRLEPGALREILHPGPGQPRGNHLGPHDAALSGIDIPTDLTADERVALEAIVATFWARRTARRGR